MTSKIKLFTFPYAGGSANLFRPWRRTLNTNIELCPVELPGRGVLYPLPMYRSIEQAVNEIGKTFKYIDSDFALFGHSMGAIIVFELLKYFREQNIKMPLHVFFSGRKAPHMNNEKKKDYYSMDDAGFRKEVILLGGTPPEVFQNEELASLFLPVLKNDFIMCENYVPSFNGNKFNIDFSVLTGTTEGYTLEELDAYSIYTSKPVEIKTFEGDHFFIKDSQSAVIDYINLTLSGLISQ